MSTAAEPQNETRAFKACLGGQVAVFEHLLSTVVTSDQEGQSQRRKRSPSPCEVSFLDAAFARHISSN